MDRQMDEREVVKISRSERTRRPRKRKTHTHTHTHKQTEKNLQTNRQVFRLIIFPGCRSEPADPGGVGGEGAGAGGPLPEADQGAHGQTQDCRHKVTQVL